MRCIVSYISFTWNLGVRAGAETCVIFKTIAFSGDERPCSHEAKAVSRRWYRSEWTRNWIEMVGIKLSEIYILSSQCVMRSTEILRRRLYTVQASALIGRQQQHCVVCQQ